MAGVSPETGVIILEDADDFDAKMQTLKTNRAFHSVVLQLSESWCQRCPAVKESTRTVRDRSGIKFYWMLIEDEPMQELAARFGVKRLPAFVIHCTPDSTRPGIFQNASDHTLMNGFDRMYPASSGDAPTPLDVSPSRSPSCSPSRSPQSRELVLDADF